MVLCRSTIDSAAVLVTLGFFFPPIVVQFCTCTVVERPMVGFENCDEISRRVDD